MQDTIKTSDRISIANIGVVLKLSRYERDRRSLELSHEQLLSYYQINGDKPNVIYESHLRQQEAAAVLKRLFREYQFIPWENLTKEAVRKFDAVISAGGDDSIQYVSHFLDQTLIIGFNTDEVLSEGVLLPFNSRNIESALKNMENGNFAVENWTMLEARLTNCNVPLAMGQYFIGSDDPEGMSTYVIGYRGQTEKQKSSGILIATGAGSTGWYNSIYYDRYKKDGFFPTTERVAKFIVREIQRGRLTNHSLLEGTLEEGEELVIHSLNRGIGRFGVDASSKYDFKRGETAAVRLSNTPLRVVKV